MDCKSIDIGQGRLIKLILSVLINCRLIYVIVDLQNDLNLIGLTVCEGNA